MPCKAFIIPYLWLCVVGYSFGQSSIVDSLESKLLSAELDSNKVILLNHLATELREKDNKRALQYAEQSSLLAQRLQYTSGLAYALENIGWIYYRKGAYSNAFETSTHALRLSDSLHNKRLIAKCLNNIAAINFEHKQFDLAIQNLKRAYAISKEEKDFMIMGRSLGNIAYMFLAKEELDSALSYCKDAISVIERSGSPYYLAFVYRTQGDLFLKLNQKEKTLDKYNQCLAIANMTGNNFLKVSTLHRLAKFYVATNQPERAIPYVEQSIALALQFNYYDELETAYKIATEVYFLLKDINAAYGYQSKFVELHDSLYAHRNSEQLAIMQTKFEAELKQAEIEILTKNTALNQHEIESQKLWMYFVIGCLGLISILAFVLFDSYRRIKVINLELKDKNREIQEQTKQLSNLNATKDKLFSIISHDLRSPVASLKGLMGIVGSSNITQQEFVVLTSKLKRRLDSVYDDLDNLLQWAQSQLKGLQANPEEFDLQNVVNEKIELFKDVARFKNVALQNEVEIGNYVFADRNHISLVLRNLLANAIKFTPEGGTIKVKSKLKDDRLEISVSDSGIGMGLDDLNKLFNAETHFTKRGTHEERGVGIGLLLTKEFVENNGGSIWVTSELGKGSTFSFTVQKGSVIVPLPYPELVV